MLGTYVNVESYIGDMAVVTSNYCHLPHFFIEVISCMQGKGDFMERSRAEIKKEPHPARSKRRKT